MTTCDFVKTLKWKREYKPDREKYDEPFYFCVASEQKEIIIEQTQFVTEGFASTVWDSSIVMSRYLEKHAAIVWNKRCLDLSAGCGLVAIVMSYLHPSAVVATDLSQNTNLLKSNCHKNSSSDCKIKVTPYTWGNKLNGIDLNQPFDLVVACDVMYSTSYLPQLIQSLEMFITRQTRALICYGRNSSAEDAFLKSCAERFQIRKIDWDEFDSVYRSEEISCVELTNS